MINDVEISTLSKILKRNDYSIDISDDFTIVIRKDKIDFKYILISLILPTFLCLIGLFDLIMEEDTFLSYIFILVGIVSATIIIRKATRKYRSKLILDDTGITIHGAQLRFVPYFEKMTE